MATILHYTFIVILQMLITIIMFTITVLKTRGQLYREYKLDYAIN